MSDVINLALAALRDAGYPDARVEFVGVGHNVYLDNETTFGHAHPTFGFELDHYDRDHYTPELLELAAKLVRILRVTT